MVPADRKPLLYTLVAGILLLALLLQSFGASLVKSPAWDEMGDIAAGLSYWTTGKFTVNEQHPPLLKELSGFAMLAGGVRWQDSPQARQLLGGGSQYQWSVGNDIVIRNGLGKTMFWARLPYILLTVLLGGLLFVWGRQMAGATAAVGTLLLYAFDPTVIANSYLVTMDLGFAAFTVLFFFTLWSYLHGPSRNRLILCGLALGAVLATKFSAVVLLPVAGLLLLVAMWRPPEVAANLGKDFLNLYDGPPPAKAVHKAGPNDPCPCGSGRKFKKCHGASGPSRAAGSGWLRRMALACGALAVMGLVAMLVIDILYLSAAGPGLYLHGLGLVNADHDPNYPFYLAGTLDKRFLSYFVAAWLLKEPIATILLAIFGTVVVWRSKRLPVLTKWFLLLPPAVLLAAHTLLASDLGIRYILPAMPFGYLAGGVGMAELWGSGVVWKRAAVGVLGVWLVVAGIGIYPDHLSYFNESACLLRDPGQIGLDGGSKCGTWWLDDSNVDWGEGLGQLKAWLDQNAAGRPLRLSYFGSFPPAAYGITGERLEVVDLMAEPKPGLYAVSAHMLARSAAFVKYQGGGESWLRRMRPVAMVGHCLYIYDVR